MKRSINFCVLLATLLSSFAHSCTNNQLLEGKNILILGGTGYLGRAIATEVLKYNPNKVIIFSRDEVKHFNISKIFAHHPQVESVIGDIRNYESLLRATKNVDIVFHVAALKRMDLIETNVEEAIKTNVLGSLHVFNACITNNVQKVLFVSTDKACSPINAYGACKFVSEKVFTNYDKRNTITQFVVARFGNILESTGSVIPIFSEKIKNGEDIPLTDDRMTRFIISKDEAVELMFDALRYMSGGEIFVKALPSLKVTDLIEILKEKYNGKNSIKVIGLRPGEKLHEVLINQSEIPRTIEYNGYLIVRPSVQNIYNTDTQNIPIYVKNGLPANSISEYSSDMAIISKDSLAKLFKKLGLV